MAVRASERETAAAAGGPGAFPVLILALALALGGCDIAAPTAEPGATSVDGTPARSASAHPSARPSPSVGRPVVARPGSALRTLEHLRVKGRAPLTGYSRAEFGPAWRDVDHNGCDTRNDVLRRDLRSVVPKPGTGGCVVLTGVLRDPYTGTIVRFHRGVGTSTRVQIDHVVALGDAWQKGARALSPDERLAFANDPLNLLAIEGSVNAAKGDGDAATWLPPLRSERCPYVARQIAVKARYHLWVTAAEREAMRRVLSTCPSQRLMA